MSKPKTSKPMKRVTLTVDPDDYESIETLAQRSNVSASWLIRRSMREFLEHHEGETSIVIPLDKRTG